MKFLDLLGYEIHKDDIVAAAMTVSQRGEMRIGKVVELIEKTGKVRVEWLKGHSFFRDVKPISLVEGRQDYVMRNKVHIATGDIRVSRFIVIDPNHSTALLERIAYLED